MRRRDGTAGMAAPSADEGSRVEAPAVPVARHYGRLYRKYLVLILSLVSGALLVSGAISVYFSYQEQQTALGNLQEEKAVAAASRIEQYIRQIERQLSYAALPQLDPSDVEMRRIEFLKLLRQVPEVTDICWIDGEGLERICVSRLGMDRKDSGKDWSELPAFKLPKRGAQYFGPVYFKKETEPYMTVAVRPSGDKGPVTAAELNLKFIWDVVSRIKVGERGKAYVVDRSGYLVADPDIGLVLRKTHLGHLAHVQAALSNERHDDAAMRSHDLAGTPVLAAWAPIESLDWMVFVEQPVAEVYAKLNASIVRTGLLLLAGLVVSAFVALILARGMVRPIRTLSEGARRIGEGNLDQRIEVKTGDELEALADRFNRMSGQLKESYAGLERKVEERTSELKYSLEQQTAISEILRVISASPTDVKPVLEAVAERAAHLCAATYARVLLIDGPRLHPIAGFQDGHSATDDELAATAAVPLDRTSLTGRAGVERRTIHEPDIVPLLEREYPGARSNMEMFGLRAVLVVPLMRESGAYGGIILARTTAGPFRDDQVALVETFARQAAIAIDNVRLFNETKEALDQQTAISEVLRVISGSPGDVRPMLMAVAERALKLCDAAQATIVLVDADSLRCVAAHGTTRSLQEGEVMPLTRGSVAGRAVIDGVSFQVEDLALAPEIEFPVGRELQRRIGHHTALAVPLMREDRAIGAIQLWRMETRAFTDKQIALVETFADQAAIAIENVRLFNETKDALAKQTAIGDILRVTAVSPTAVEPVLAAVAERAAALCDAPYSVVFLIEGAHLVPRATHGAGQDHLGSLRAVPIRRDTVNGRAVLDRTAVQVADIVPLLDNEFPGAKRYQEGLGFRSVLSIPVMREGSPTGVIFLGRREPRPFEAEQVALVQTFAHQLAIALDNVRLFDETKEALDQQRASGEVLAAISNSIADTAPVFETILASCERLFGGKTAAIDLVGEDGLAHIGAYHGPGLDGLARIYPHAVDLTSATGTAILTRNIVHYPNIEETPGVARAAFTAMGIKAAIGAPMLSEGKGIGAIWVTRDYAGPFTDKEIALLRTFADQAVIAIQNARLVNETKEALDQQRASSEVLAAISGSISDTAPVFDKILQSCERLFAGKIGVVNLIGGDGQMRLAAYHGPGQQNMENVYPLPVESSATGVAIERRAVVHYPDIDRMDDVPSGARLAWNAMGIKAAIGAPMLWEGTGIGSIFVGRDYPGPFSDKDMALLKTFADQAVIAIQNARLFREIADKSRQLEIANQHKSAFLASMSHELRTPLNAIIGFSEVLLERYFGELNEKQDDYLKDIHSSGKHLLALINEVLDLSKVEAGRMELDRTEFDLAAAVADAMTLIRERAQQHGIALGIDAPPGLGNIRADERKFKQILLNLLSNAVKFTPDGGRIDVQATRNADGIQVAVRDTGIGIAPEDRDAVFEEFRQVGRDYMSKHEGTGLGLALCKRLVELHGGRIWLDSTPGHGSTFYFTLPEAS